MEHCRETRSPEEEGNVVIVRTTDAAGKRLDRARRLLLTSSSCGLCGKGSIESLRGHFPPVTSTRDVDPARSCAACPRPCARAQPDVRPDGRPPRRRDLHARGRAARAREDIGRHNAVDKAIGSLFREGRLPLSERSWPSRDAPRSRSSRRRWPPASRSSRPSRRRRRSPSTSPANRAWRSSAFCATAASISMRGRSAFPVSRPLDESRDHPAERGPRRRRAGPRPAGRRSRSPGRRAPSWTPRSSGPARAGSLQYNPGP